MISGVRRAAAVSALSLGILAVASPAFAQVTVHTDEPYQGATDAAVAFRTPNEESAAATVKLQVFFPTRTPMLGVLVEPHPGWSSVATSVNLPMRVATDDGAIRTAVSEVTWTADSKADGLQPGQAADFVVDAAQLPTTSTLTFKALQTYSDGDVVKWTDVQAPGADEPKHPAPILTLLPDSDQPGASMSSSMPGMEMTATPAKAAKSSNGVALVLSIVALLIALGALGLALTRGRSTVSYPKVKS